MRSHLTLAYDATLRDIRLPVDPIRFRADEVTLIASPQGAGRHVPLQSWTLTHRRSPLLVRYNVIRYSCTVIRSFADK